MKIKRIEDINDEALAKLETLLSNDKIVVKKITTIPLTNEHGIGIANFYIFYEDVEEALALEKAELSALKPIAERVRADPVYKEMKNARQREIFLLEKYNLPKETADDVIEYIKVIEIVIEHGLDNLVKKVAEEPANLRG